MWITRARPHGNKNVGINVQIAVGTDTLPGNIVLCPISGPHHGRCVTSVLRIAGHWRGAIENLVDPKVDAAISIDPTIRGVPRIGDEPHEQCLMRGTE